MLTVADRRGRGSKCKKVAYLICERSLMMLLRKVIRISSDVANSASKPVIWVDGGIHAREWVSSHTTIYIANSLLGEVEPTLQTQVPTRAQKIRFGGRKIDVRAKV